MANSSAQLTERSDSLGHLPRPLESLRYDLASAVVVFLVAVPLCLGIALASGAPLISGLISGIVGGVLVGAFSGSHLSVSGPAAGLAVICAGGIRDLGSFEGLLTAVVIAGLIQILLAACRLGFAAEYVPNSVIKGVVAGIGLVIILKQLPHALGRHSDYTGDEGFSQVVDGENSLTAIWLALQDIHPLALLISLSSLLILVLWDKRVFPEYSFHRKFPAPLVVVILGSFLASFIGSLNGTLALARETGHFVQLPDYESLQALLYSLPSPNWSLITSEQVWQLAITIAVVASIEGLLSVEASDRIDPFRRISSTNRELYAQGIGNCVSGLLGGLPLTSVLVRSSANVYAGGRTKASSIMQGLMLLFAVVIVPQYLNLIPLSALAAILIHIGFKLSHPKLFRKMFESDLSRSAPFFATVLGIVFTDLLFGVCFGFAVGFYFVFKTNHHDAITLVHEGRDYLLRFNKDMSFVNKAELKRALARVPDGSELTLDGTRAMFIDYDIAEIVQDFIAQASFRGITVEARNIERKDLSRGRRRSKQA